MDRRLTTALLYAIALSGALCNTLGIIRPFMTVATPIVIVIAAVAAFVLTYRVTMKSVSAGVGVLAMVFLCQASGANLGFPFGEYAYTDLLGPRLLDVPMVTPFMWLAVLIPCWVASGLFLKYKHVAVAALLATVFDAVLEFAADGLDLWHWKDGMPTELNYISWFALSYASLALLRSTADEREPNPLVAHLLVSQLLYFLLTDVGLRFLSVQV
jgi:putative membrane protein